jgi:hypothetical protein
VGNCVKLRKPCGTDIWKKKRKFKVGKSKEKTGKNANEILRRFSGLHRF